MQRGAGTTLVETLLVLALVGILAVLGLRGVGLGHRGLDAVEGEFRGCLEQAMLRAQAQGGEVRLGLKAPVGALAPLVLPRGVRWGLPATGIPLPLGMGPPVHAQRTGEAHALVTVTPRHTAQGSVWFLTDGRDALCMRLGDQGQLTVLRWRHAQQKWIRR